jgi:membrane fusion protein (multidrug efflux system)
VGTPLFQLDDASYRAAVLSAQATLAKAQAALPVAQAANDRAIKLLGSGYSQAEVESFAASYAEAQADVQAAQSALDYAKTELSWTTVSSPIEGVAEVASVSVGDLVSAGQAEALTTVTRLDPIDVVMLEASARLLKIRGELRDGTISPTQEIKAELTLENGKVYVGQGTLVAPSVSVSTTTGSVDIRFRFENPQDEILPGMFVRGAVELGTIEAYLVPQRAATRAPDGSLTAFVVGADNKAVQVRLTGDGSYQNAWIVTAGLKDGDQLVLDGLKTMRAGAALKPVPASLDANGLVKDDAAPAGTDPAPAAPTGTAPAGTAPAPSAPAPQAPASAAPADTAPKKAAD